MPPQQRSATVAERLREKSGELTAAERKLMAALFANYPMAGLVSITEFARVAEVSTPSVLRLAKKLGFAGFPVVPGGTPRRTLRAIAEPHRQA